MLRLYPKHNYAGLTVVMSNPSRFDIDFAELLSANGGTYFNEECLRPHGITKKNCDIRLAADKSPLIGGTKVVMLLGQKALDDWAPKELAKGNTIGEMRGSPLESKQEGVIYIPSFLPQDATDRQNYESKLNPVLLDQMEHEAREKEETDPTATKKRKGLTLRNNYRFWLRKDTDKALKILLNGGQIPYDNYQPEYILYPNSSDVINLLSSTKSKNFFFDMETDPTLRITVFAFSFDLGPIYIVPLVLHNYSLAYSDFIICRILRALAVAIRDNCTVAHNGAGFDYFVLGWRYKIPIGWDVYDTMVAGHRCYPEIEKSLGHGVSLWTYEIFHKDEAAFNFGNKEQWTDNCYYCGKDVSTMVRIHRAIGEYSTGVPGLTESINQAMLSIRPYLTSTFLGIPYRQDKVVETMTENDRLCMQYLRILRLLIGEESWSILKKKSKKALPGSNTQCCHYFHEMLGYPVIMRSKKTRNPSLAEKVMLKLKLKQPNNPCIDFILAFRKLAKETGSLKFNPWKQ